MKKVQKEFWKQTRRAARIHGILNKLIRKTSDNNTRENRRKLRRWQKVLKIYIEKEES